MIKWLLTDFGQAGRVNIWLSVMTHRPRCAQSVHRDLEPNIFFHTFHLDNFFCAYFPFGSFYSRERKNRFFRITRINQYQSSWFTVRPSLIYGFLHFTDVQRPVIFFFQIIRDLSRKISFSTAIISWVIPLMDFNLHESLIDIRPSYILIFSLVKFYLSNNEALRYKE